MKHKILLFLVITMSYIGTSFAQKVTLDFQQTKLEKVFSSISKQTGYTFAYSKPSVNTDYTVSISVSNVNLVQALNQLFIGTDIAFEINNEKIFLISKKSSVREGQTPNQSIPQVPVKGTILDEKGEPVIQCHTGYSFGYKSRVGFG